MKVPRWLQHFAILFFIFAMLGTAVSFAGPSRTTYQAKIVKPDGYPLEATSVNFRFTILDPTATCILYSENYNGVNMSSTGGLISFSLGSGVKTFPVSATTFEQVFSNITPFLACDSGGPANYSPSANDMRRIVMQFNDGGGWQTLPAMTINAVPYAMYANDAMKFNGLQPSDFVQVSTIPTCAASEAIHYNGSSFSCVAVGTSTSVTSGSVVSALGYTPADGASVTALTSNVASVSSTVFSVSSTVTSLQTSVAASLSTITTSLSGLSASMAAMVSSQWSSSGTTINYLNGSVGIGTNNPAYNLHIVKPVSGGVSVGLDAFGGTAGIYARRANGTSLSPQPVSAAQALLEIAAVGYGQTNYLATSAAKILMTAEENWTDATGAASIRFHTRGSSTTAASLERMRIAGNGFVGIGTIAPVTALDVSGGIRIGSELSACSAAVAGTLRYNAGVVEYCDGTSWVAFGVSGAGILAINGLTSGSQTFAFGTANSSPSVSSTGTVHTFNFPLASVATTTAGLISNIDFLNFSNKITSSAASVAQVLGFTPANQATMATSFAAVTTTTNNLATSITGLAASATNLTTATNSLTTSATNLTTTVNVLSTSATNLTASVNALTTSATNLTASATNLTTLSNSLASSITSLANTVATSFAGITSSQWVNSGTSIYYNSGNVAIGTNSATSVLDIRKMDPVIRIKNTGGDIGGMYLMNSVNSGWLGLFNPSTSSAFGVVASSTSKAFLAWDSGGKIGTVTNSFTTGNPGAPSYRVVIDDGSGQMGIGTSSPTNSLHVYRNSSMGAGWGSWNTANSVARFQEASGNGLYVDGNTIISDVSGSMSFGTLQAYPLSIGTSNTERMHITNDGLIGIGTNSPGGNVHISGSIDQHLLRMNSASASVIIGEDSDIPTVIRLRPTVGSGVAITGANDTPGLFVYSANSNVAIGGAHIPTAALHLRQGSNLLAPLKFTSGSITTAAQAGAMEFDGFNFFLTDGAGVRRTIATGSSTGSIDNASQINSAGNITMTPTGSVIVSSTTASLSASTGALVVNGGVGIAGNTNIAGDANITGGTNIAGTLTASNAIMALSTGMVGIGASTPAAKLDLRSEGAVKVARIQYSGTGFGTQPNLEMFRSRGTLNAPTAVTTNDILGSISALGYNGTSFGVGSTGSIMFRATQPFTPTEQGTYITFSTTASGTNTQVERMRIDAAGNVGIGTVGPQAEAKLDVNGAIRSGVTNGTFLYLVESATSGVATTDGVRMSYESSVFGTNQDGVVFEKTDGNATVADGGFMFAYRGSGNVRTPILTMRGGNVGIGMAASTTTRLQIASGTTSFAPLRFTSGSLNTVPQTGAMEFDGYYFYLTDEAGVRRSIAAGVGSGTIDNASLISSTGNITMAPTGSVVVSSTTAATNSQTGALVVKGGLGLAGSLYASGSIITSSVLQATSITATTGLNTPLANIGFVGQGSALLDIRQSTGLAGDFVHFRDTTDGADLYLRYTGSHGWSFQSEDEGAGATSLSMSTPYGYVGAGVSAPIAPLHVLGGLMTALGTEDDDDGILIQNFQPTLTFKDNTVGDPDDMRLRMNQTSLFIESSPDFFVSSPVTTTLITVNASGYLGVGNTNPDYSLSLHNASAPAQMELRHTGTGKNDPARFVVDETTNNSGELWIQPTDDFDSAAGDKFHIGDYDTRLSRFTILGNGYVGVGTSAPVSLLEVSSENFGDSVLRVESDADDNNESDNPRISLYQDGGSVGMHMGFSNETTANAGNTFSIARRYGSVDDYTTFNINTANGNVGIGTSAPVTARLVLTRPTASGSQLAMFSNLNAGYVTVPTNGEGLIFSSSRYDGSNWITNSTSAAAVTINEGNIQFFTNNGLTIGASHTYTERARFDSNGNFMIGAGASTDKFSVTSNGAVYMAVNNTGASNKRTGVFFKSAGAAQYEIGVDANVNGTRDFYIYDSVSATQRLSINSVGNVGIGVGYATYLLQLGTDSAAKPGTNTWTIASDMRLKESRAPFTRSINELLGLETIYFKYKKDNALGLPSDKEYVGIRAQDVQKVIPEAVTKDEKGFLHFTSDPVFWTVVNSVKELYHKLIGHDEQLEKQGREIASIRQENEKLKAENADKDKQLHDIRAYLCAKDPAAPICK